MPDTGKMLEDVLSEMRAMRTELGAVKTDLEVLKVQSSDLKELRDRISVLEAFKAKALGIIFGAAGASGAAGAALSKLLS